MSSWGYVVIGAAVGVVIVGAVLLLVRRERSRHLRSTFSSEYDRAVATSGSRQEAEDELREREKRREQLQIVPLSPSARERFADRWRDVQTAFVDTPDHAVREANVLVEEVMSDRGYPVDDFEQQAALISVDHANVVENYRAAHAIWLTGEGGRASTEALRQAMRHYRVLFDELLGDDALTTDGRAEEAEYREKVAR
jgi:hypothetical protein